MSDRNLIMDVLDSTNIHGRFSERQRLRCGIADSGMMQLLQVDGTGGATQLTVPYPYNDWPLYMIAGPTSEPVDITMVRV